MEEYMKLLLEQIRCKKACPYIRKEILGHLEDQMEENMLSGMSKEEAEKAAVEDMGSPVEVGIALDRIHRPQIAWGMILLMALISVAGVVLHQGILENLQIADEAIGSPNFTMYTIIGFVLMLIVYHIDYSMIARFSKIIATVLIGICGYALVDGEIAAGSIVSMRIGELNMSLHALMMLYVPLYGAVIYKYHGSGYKGLMKALVWMLVPVYITFYLPSLSLALILLVSMSVVLTVAIVHDWFKVSKKIVIASLWVCELGLPIGGLTIAYALKLLKEYQMARLQAFLINSGEANFITARLRTILAESKIIGDSGNELVGYLPDFNSSFILSYVSSTYGLIAGIIICCTLAVLIIMIFTISFRQKNQLGMCMGCGCGMIMLLNIVINIGENVGLLPITQTFLPFFSVGGSFIITCYILMGIILSIYRYKNIYPKHTNVNLPVVKLTIDL